jgi:hypothetical protein
MSKKRNRDDFLTPEEIGAMTPVQCANVLSLGMLYNHARFCGSIARRPHGHRHILCGRSRILHNAGCEARQVPVAI